MDKEILYYDTNEGSYIQRIVVQITYDEHGNVISEDIIDFIKYEITSE